MSRAQAIAIGFLLGFVLLTFISIFVMLLLPYDKIFPALVSPMPTLPPPTLTPTPTFPNFLPTAQPIPTTTPEPTPTNTLVPTVTPPPSRPPSPTVELSLPTFAPKPTDTPTPPPLMPPTLTPPPPPTQMPARHYSISFKAEETELAEDECTDLEWVATGASRVTLDNKSVGVMGTKEVCPERDTTYTLSVQLPNSAQIIRREVKISVE